MRSIIVDTSITTDLLKSANVGIVRFNEGIIIGGINPPIIEFKDDMNDSVTFGFIAASACSYVHPHLSRHLKTDFLNKFY